MGATVAAGRHPTDRSSARGVLYLSDGPTGDRLVDDAVRALDALLATRPGVGFPDGSGEVGRALWGGAGDSPSIVWHAQAAGALLEMGLSPATDAVRFHTAMLGRRLDAANVRSPETAPRDDPWLLRTRHVAWVLACLSEHSAAEVAGSKGSAHERARSDLQEFIDTASDYLSGEGDDGPATWIGRRSGERFWSEHWDDRHPNLLNSLYASLAMCRAVRHGLLSAPPNVAQSYGGAPGALQPCRDLLDLVRVEATPAGPRAVIAGDWREPWAGGALPPSIVGLLGLILHEYANMLITSSRLGSDQEIQGRRMVVLAQRLAHDLLSRAKEWTQAIDAFYYPAAEGGWWFICAYSVCVRAILETEVASPWNPVVRDAFRTIDALAVPPVAGRAYMTWLDPTRAKGITDVAGDAEIARRFASLRVDRTGDRPPTVPTANSIHAAIMAYAALRRAFGAADPRAALVRQPDGRLPSSPFDAIELRDAGPRGATLCLRGDGGYVEQVRVGPGCWAMLQCLDGPGGVRREDAEIGGAVARRLGQVRGPKMSEGVRAAIRHLNARLGVALVDRGPGGGSVLTCELPA